MGVKVTGQFEPAGDFSIVDGKDVSGNITGSNISSSGQIEAASIGTNLASIISGSTPFDATAVSGSLGSNATLIRSLTAVGISGSVTSVSASIATDINTFRDGTATLVSGSSTSTGSFGSLKITDAHQGTLKINGGLTLAGSGPNINGAGGNVYMIPTNFIVRSSISNDSGDVTINDNLIVRDNISGSVDSTGSFGRVESDAFNATTFTSTEVTSTNLTVTGTITGSSLDVSGDGIFGGNIRAVGDVIAERYIVSSSVTHLTQSFSSGSTIFGDSSDDTHVFTGSLSVNGNVTLPSTSHKVGIGIAPTSTLHVGGGSGRSLLVDSTGGTTSIISRKDGNQIRLLANGSNPILGYGHTGGNARNLLITSNDTTVATFTSGGDLLMSDGNDISGSSTSTGSFGAVSAVTSLFTNRIANSVGQGAFTLDSADDIILDAGGGDVLLYDDGSEFARLTNDSNTLAIKSSTSNADIVFNGVDSGANITALRLDMSEKGKAIFNSDVSGSSTSTGSFGAGFISNKFGIGTTAPDTELHIHQGSAGFTDTHANYILTLEGSSDVIMQFKTPNNRDTVGIVFGDPDDRDAGRVIYDHTTDRLNLFAAGTQQLQIGSNIISGSSTSTGSFGELHISDRIGVGTTAPTGQLHVNNAGGSSTIFVDGNTGAFQTYAFKSGGSTKAEIKNFHETRMEFTQTGGIYRFNTISGTQYFEINSSGIEAKVGNISGSATSTGSFGSLVVADAIQGDTNVKGNFSVVKSFPDIFTKSSDEGRIGFMDAGGSIQSGMKNNAGDLILVADGNTERVRVNDGGMIVAGNISGSSTSTGSFGAVAIGKATADNQRALTVVGNAQFDNNAQIYFKRSTGTADPYISYDSSDNFKIFNPLSGEIQLIIGSGEIVAVDSNGLTFNGSKTIGSSAGSGVITVTGNSGLKLKSGAGGGSGAIEFIQGSTTHWQVGVSGDITGSAGSHISGSSTSTGSFGRVEAKRFSGSYAGQMGSRFVHSQTSAGTTWTINHNLGHKYPVVTVYDSSDQMILPQNGIATDSDTFTLTFNESITGKAVVSIGGIGTNAGNNYIHTQGAGSTNWRVTHSLSQRYPNVTVFDENNQVILPETITATSANHADIVFSTQKTGYANFSIGSGIPNISSGNAGKFLKVRADGEGVEWVPTTANVSGSMSVSGSILPNADNHHDLGSESKRWANLFTGDIELSNEGTEGNEVDGTTGKWTIQEGKESLYLLNRKNGKKYRFKLEEIT